MLLFAYLSLELARTKVALVGEPHLVRQLPQSFRHETLMAQDVVPASDTHTHTNYVIHVTLAPFATNCLRPLCGDNL